MELYKKHISDLGRIVTGKTPRTSIPDNYGGKIPFLTPSDDLTGKYAPQTNKTITQLGLNEVKNCLLPSKSVCVSCIGSDLGKAVITNEPTVTNQQFNSIIPNEENDADFIYYLMSAVGKHLNFLSKTSTAVPIINKSTFSDYEIDVPSIPDQIKIAKVLSSLDDKIEVNRRMNENLEQQAQALFKSWFVDFEPFKDKPFVESELGMIPHGWSLCELSDLALISKVSINPLKQPQTVFEHYSIPSYDDEMNPEIQFGENIKSNKFVIENKMILFSKLNPRIKRVWYIDHIGANSVCSTEFVPYKAKDESKSVFLYGLINGQGFYDFVLSMVNGATGSHQRFHPEESLKYKVAYNEEYCEKYCAIISPMINQILGIRDESRRLAELRDTLLPRLISGELKVNDVDA